MTQQTLYFSSGSKDVLPLKDGDRRFVAIDPAATRTPALQPGQRQKLLAGAEAYNAARNVFAPPPAKPPRKFRQPLMLCCATRAMLWGLVTVGAGQVPFRWGPVDSLQPGERVEGSVH